MSEPQSDALVFFGATGDLAYNKIFPALQGMVRRGHLNVPVLGVAKASWGLEQLKARARESVEKHGGLDPAAFCCPRGGGLQSIRHSVRSSPERHFQGWGTHLWMMGRVALITGAGRGIGAATALVLAKHGYQAIVNHRTSRARCRRGIR
jgi:hypothetical protein